MVFVIRNLKITVGRKQLFIASALLVAWGTLVASRFNPVEAIVLLGFIYLVLLLTTKPLSRFIARLEYSIRWKFEIGIAVIAVLFLVVSLIQIRAMNFTHDELHNIQDIGLRHSDVSEPRLEMITLQAVDNLEDTHHGAFYRLLPFIGILGVLGSAAVGSAMAWSVIGPVRKMEQGMDRIASGDFSQQVEVENEDELGDLAGRINDTAADLAKLQEATLAQERARALQERIVQVTTAQEEERRRISRDLHDGLGPSLAAIGNRLRACQRMVRTDPQQAERELEKVTDGLRVHVQEVSELIHDLRPLALDQLGLVEAVRQHVERFDQDTGVRTSFDAHGEIGLNPFAEVTIYRLVQECLTNVQKHAKASTTDVRFRVLDNKFEVVVRDDGQGFDPKPMASGAASNGLGLLSMQERAELLGGSLSIRSSPLNGCEITLIIPAQIPTQIPTGEVGVGAN